MVIQGETVLQPFGLTAKKVKSIDFGPINFEPNKWAITKCNYYRIWFSLANFSVRSAAIFSLCYFADPFTISSASKSQLSSLINKKIKWMQRTTWSTHSLSSFSMIIRCHKRITIIEMILASLISRHFHLFTWFFQQWRQKKVDSFERLRHASPASFYIPYYFQCECFAMRSGCS